MRRLENDSRRAEELKDVPRYLAWPRNLDTLLAYHGLALEVHLIPYYDLASVMSKIVIAASAPAYCKLEGYGGKKTFYLHGQVLGTIEATGSLKV